MNVNEIVFGKSLEEHPGELQVLAKKVESGELRSKLVVNQEDGDVRYWGVDPKESPVLTRLMEFATSNYRDVVGKAPDRAFIMMNRVSAEKAPQGSGGAWHRDSFPDQYKAFVYLVDVDRESQGPFCIIPKSNTPLARAVSVVGWLAAGRKSHDQPAWVVRFMERAKMEKRPVLAKAGVPFFANTSLVHRGLPITEGQRIAATVYLLKKGDPPFRVNGTTLE